MGTGTRAKQEAKHEEEYVMRSTPRRRKEQTSNNEGPVFLRKTFDMINSMHPSLGGWSNSGDTFIIKDTEVFARTVIPKFFKTGSKFSSFVRQLNFYGFRKVKSASSDSSWSEFKHDIFHRDRPDMLSEIKRATHFQAPPEKGDVDSLKGEVHDLQSRLARMDDKVNQLTDVVENLLRELKNRDAPTNHTMAHTVFAPVDAISKKRKVSIDGFGVKEEVMEDYQQQQQQHFVFAPTPSNYSSEPIDLVRVMSTSSDGSFMRDLDHMGFDEDPLVDSLMDFRFSPGPESYDEQSVIPVAELVSGPLEAVADMTDSGNAVVEEQKQDGGAENTNVQQCDVALARSIDNMSPASQCKLAENLFTLIKESAKECEQEPKEAQEKVCEKAGEIETPAIAFPLTMAVLGAFITRFAHSCPYAQNAIAQKCKEMVAAQNA